MQDLGILQEQHSENNSPRSLVYFAWGRLLLSIFVLGMLLGARQTITGWQPLFWLTVGVGLYDLAIVVLLRGGRWQVARWVGGSFDALTLAVGLFLVARYGTPSIVNHEVMMVGLLLAVATSIIHFGALAGTAVSMGLVAWYLALIMLVEGYAGSQGTLLLQAPVAVVVGGLITSLSSHLRAEQKPARTTHGGAIVLDSRGAKLARNCSRPGGDISVSLLSRTSLYVAEEQPLLMETYKAFFLERWDINVVGASSDTSSGSLLTVASVLKPDVMVLGFKVLTSDAVEKLEAVRESNPEMAIVVLSSYYDVKGIRALREFSGRFSAGCAYLLKHTIDRMDQLSQAISWVAEGRVLLDPAVMEGLAASAQYDLGLLSSLTHKEIEILNWMSKGYSDEAIAKLLGLQPKVFERRIKNIYGKLGEVTESKDARVQAITIYLKATGQVPD